MNEYFSHDYYARNDLNIKKLFMAEGLAGIGLYWCVIEMLYEKDGYIELSYIPTIAFDLRTTEEFVHNVIHNYGLFECTDTHFYSNSVLTRLNLRAEKAEKARKSAAVRWAKTEKETEKNAFAMRTHSERYAIKENKSKVNNIIVSKKVSNKKNILYTSCAHAHDVYAVESYDTILDDLDVKGVYRSAIIEFIKHLQLNGYKVLNSRLESMIIALDRKYKTNDAAKANEIHTAIASGYKRLPSEI